jgi:hypothetical protein
MITVMVSSSAGSAGAIRFLGEGSEGTVTSAPSDRADAEADD